MAAMISSRGRYALRVLTELASRERTAYVPLNQIAARQELSLKYVESIMTVLSKGGLVEGLHGKGGGYRLARAPEALSLAEILRLTEGSLAPVACLSDGAAPCARTDACPSLPVWEKLERIVTEYLESVSLADLVRR